MTSFERQQRLLGLLRTEPGLRVPEMAERLCVSDGTIRNDLAALTHLKLVMRVHGGAVVNDAGTASAFFVHSSTFADRLRQNQAAKESIGVQAGNLIADGDAILLDASSTVFHLAQSLKNRRNLRVVTNCLETAQLLAQNPTHSVMLVGGILRAGMVSVIGPWSEQLLSELCTRLAFVSCSGFTPEGGMTEVDVFEAQFRLKAIQCAGQVIGLADSTKFGKVDLTQSLRPEQIDHLYTDSKLELDWQERLVKVSIPFTICHVENNL